MSLPAITPRPSASVTDVPQTSSSARRRRQVLFLNDTARNGGPGRSLQTLLRWLDPTEVERTVILPRPGEVADLLRDTAAADHVCFEPGWVENIFEPWSRPIEARDFDAPLPVRFARAAANVVRMTRAFWRLRARIARDRPSLVYCNGTTANFVGALLGAATGVPVLWHARYTAIPRAIARLHRRLAASAAVRKVVCVSHPTAALFAHCSDKVVVIANGVDTEAFDPSRTRGVLRSELGYSDAMVIFGSHGRVLRRKGFVEFLRAAGLALGALAPEERARCRFCIVGDTPRDIPPDHLAECRRLAQTLGIADMVAFLGFRADVRGYVADYDVAVVPSVYPDPLPRAVIESMALGKPVLAFDVGGVGEMLGPEEGSLIPSGEAGVAVLARAMVRAFRDPELRRRQGQAARARVLREFDGRAHARRVLVHIDEAIHSPAVGSGNPRLSSARP